MANLHVEKISNGTVSVGGLVVWGGPNEFSFDGLKFGFIDFAALGMLGTIQMFAKVEKMEATVKLNHFNADVAAKFGNPFSSIQLQIRTNKEKYDSLGRVAEVPLVYKLTATPTSIPGISQKAQEMGEFETTFAVSSVTIEENSVEIVHFNAFTNEFRINGVDKTAAFRANLGI